MLSLSQIIDNIRTMVIYPVFIGLSVVMFLWAGIIFITSVGDPGKIDKAKKAFIWGVIGIAVGFLGYVITGFIKKILGV